MGFSDLFFPALITNITVNDNSKIYIGLYNMTLVKLFTCCSMNLACVILYVTATTQRNPDTIVINYCDNFELHL